MEKKKRIISYENLEPKVQELLHKKFPAGFVGHVQRIQSPKGETLSVVQLETADSIFMVKVKLTNPKKAKGGGDDEEDEIFGDDIPEAGEGFDKDKDEFGAGDEEDDSYGDGPAEEYDDDDKDED